MTKKLVRKMMMVVLAMVMAMGTWASAETPIYYGSDAYFASQAVSNWITRYVNGKPIPISGYGEGTYFTSDGTACTDHDEENEPAIGAKCIYRNYKGGCHQCAAFAWDVYVNLFGDVNYGFYEGSNTITTSWNASSAKSFFESTVSPGAHIRVYTKRGNKHSFIFVESDSTGITLYDANAINTCAVRMSKYTYEQLVTSYPARYWYQTPHKFNANWAVSAGTSGHYVGCSYAGCSEHSTTPSPHYVIGTPGYGKCAACNYTGYISIGTTSIGDDNVAE